MDGMNWPTPRIPSGTHASDRAAVIWSLRAILLFGAALVAAVVLVANVAPSDPQEWAKLPPEAIL